VKFYFNSFAGFCRESILATIPFRRLSVKRLEWVWALIGGLLAAAFLFQGNLHTDDTGIVAGLIVTFAAALAFLFHKPGLVSGSLLGLSIVASEFWNLRFGVPRTHMAKVSDFVLLFLLVSALSVAGSLAGFGARRTMRRARPTQV
jgi:hypothetical protein